MEVGEGCGVMCEDVVMELVVSPNSGRVSKCHCNVYCNFMAS